MALDKNPDTINAEIKLLNTSGTKSFLLVEGRFDYNFWRNKKKCNEVEIIDCQGRDNLEAVVFRNKTIQIAKLLGITDRDFDFFNLQPVYRNDDLIYTDYNDLETTILSFGIANHLISTLCDLDRMRRDGLDPDDEASIFNDSLFVGKLRYISKKNRYNFPFQKKYSMGRYYSSTYVFDHDALLQDFSKFVGFDKNSIMHELNITPETPFWHMTRGHDCLLNLYNLIQRYKHTGFKPLNIEVYIQCMFMDDWLRQCTLYQDIKSWEISNCCTLVV